MAKLFGGPPWFMKKSPKFSWGFGKNKVPEKPHSGFVNTVKRNPGGGWDAFYNYAVIGNSPTKEEAMAAAEVVALT